jgi:hypothetical protein
MMRARMVVLSGLMLFPAMAQPSTPRLHDHNLHTWLVFAGDHAVSGRWGVHLEVQWRRHDGGVRPQQLLLRPAVNYQLRRNVALSAGYAYVTTHRYGEYPVAAPFPEHRLYQQAIIPHKTGRVDFSHRLRMEQRWLRQPATSTWRYQNRFRYLLRVVVPLKRAPWYFAAYDELFLNYAPTQGARAFDQNRAFAGIGRTIPGDTRVEAGYMQQTLLQRNGRVLELNHTIQVAVYSRLPFGGDSGRRN